METVSAPTSMTPQKTAASDGQNKSPMNNPTPAMLELMKKIDRKKNMTPGQKSKLTAANKLLAGATRLLSGDTREKLTTKQASSSNVVEKKKRGRSAARTLSPKKELMDKTIEIGDSSPEVTPKKGRGRPKGSLNRNPKLPQDRPRSSSSKGAVKLSSSSSTHSTKENKYAVPPRRSPRVAKEGD